MSNEIKDIDNLRRWNNRGTGSAAEVHRRLGHALDEIERLQAFEQWADSLAETLRVYNAQHGGRNAARLLKDYRDACATLKPKEGRSDG